MSFKDLIPHPEILTALEELGYLMPTPIQEQAIPQVIQGLDIRASAQTGTGKTAAFLLPALARLATPSEIPGFGPRILILVPTRELAMQVAAEAKKFSKYLTKTKTVCIYGGAPYPVQNRDLSRPYEILVATPGRLIDHMERGKINFGRIEMLILDEADRMLDMGFIDDVEQIAEQTPKTRQTLLFSATLKGSVLGLSKRLLKNPIEISVATEHEKHENIDQRLHNVDNIDHKYRLLNSILEEPAMHQAIVFTSTKRQADLLADKLTDSGQVAAVLHGDMRQRQRTQTIAQMRQEKIRVLVATDVAARGIDVPTISHVINFDLPMAVEDYVHRIGRTGRAGAKGIALSFATSREMQFVKRIERFTGQKLTVHTIPGMEPKTSSSQSPRKEKDEGRSSYSRERRPRQERSDRPYAKKSFESNYETPARGAFQKDRPARDSFNREDRPAREPSFNREDRPVRETSFNREEPRAERGFFGRDDRKPARKSFDRNERPFGRSSFGRDDGPRRSSFQRDGERPARDSFGADEAPRRFARPDPKKKFASKQKFRPKY